MRTETATRFLLITAGCTLLLLGFALGLADLTMTAQTLTDREVVMPSTPSHGITSPATPLLSVDTINDPPEIDTNRFFYSDGEDLEWRSVAEADSYDLQIATDPEFTGSTIDVVVDRSSPASAVSLIRDVTNIRDTRYTLDIDTGGAYFWRVRAVDQFFEPGPWSSVGEFSLAVSSVATADETEVSAGPNPCLSCIYRVHSEASPIKGVRVYDPSGRLLLAQEYTEGASDVTLDLSTLSGGLYIVTTTQVDGSVVGRRVVVE